MTIALDERRLRLAPQPAPTTHRQSRLARLLGNVDFRIAFLVSTIGAVLIGYGIARFPTLGGDEGIYTAQAWSMLHGQITPYTYTYDHPFFGWAQLASLSWLVQWLHIGGSASVLNVRVIMIGYAFVEMMLVYGIARRLDARRVTSAGAVLLLGLCPLYVVEARQVLLDNLAMPWVLAALYIALNRKQKLWNYGLAGILLGVGILSKETVGLLLPALVYVVWTKAYRPTRAMSMASFVTLGTLTVATYPLFAALRKELFPGAGHVSLWTNGVMYQLKTRAGSGALWQAHSGKYDLFLNWMHYDPYLIAAGAAVVLPGLFIKRTRAIVLCFLLWALPIIKPGGYLPAMYIIAGLPFAALSVALFADTLWSAATRMRLRKLAVGVVIAACTIGAVSIGASYLKHDRKFTTSTMARGQVKPSEQAISYINAHRMQQDNVLTDDSVWVDLVRSGFGEPWHGAISYYQFDLDPISSAANLPQGWQDINWVIETPSMQGDLPQLPAGNTKNAIDHSAVVAQFGSGDATVWIRKVEVTAYNNHGG